MLDDRLRKLARNLDRAAEKDQQRVQREREVEQLRKDAAAELHSVCVAFVTALNAMVRTSAVELSPERFEREQFQEGRECLFQVSASGRVIQLSFVATGPLLVSDDMKSPYTLEGSVHWYNQEMLERQDIQEHRLFYAVSKQGNGWRYYDPASYSTGNVDSNYLIQRMEELL